ncbi:MAG TPA: hypothetical protein VI854_07955 [Acidimicrobiia bacterium]|nr:hypothetical protein [Acidimicrobiia bacterium]
MSIDIAIFCARKKNFDRGAVRAVRAEDLGAVAGRGVWTGASSGDLLAAVPGAILGAGGRVPAFGAGTDRFAGTALRGRAGALAGVAFLAGVLTVGGVAFAAVDLAAADFVAADFVAAVFVAADFVADVTLRGAALLTGAFVGNTFRGTTSAAAALLGVVLRGAALLAGVFPVGVALRGVALRGEDALPEAAFVAEVALAEAAFLAVGPVLDLRDFSCGLMASSPSLAQAYEPPKVLAAIGPAEAHEDGSPVLLGRRTAWARGTRPVLPPDSGDALRGAETPGRQDAEAHGPLLLAPIRWSSHPLTSASRSAASTSAVVGLRERCPQPGPQDHR